ncbi:hypothetical protein FOG50_02964 [Hanseniaspora uvarum]|nr:hypothetical protein FOG50_02964 [Hanseniaspora uvarum]
MATKVKAKQAKSVTPKLNKAVDLDQLTTISSDEENENLEYESEDEDEKDKDKIIKDKKDSIQMNKNFTFQLENTFEFEDKDLMQSWDFETGEKKKEEKKDVDLDKIIKRKGGLVGLVGVEEQQELKEESDDDDLAMDGFGMGVKKDDSEVEESESEAEEEEEQQEELVEDIEAAESDEDSEEAIKNFYADKEETADIQKQQHQTFNSLELARPILKGLAALGYVKPSAIQSAAIPVALLGKDVIAGAVTGSGKTAAFMIPILERLVYKPSNVPTTRVIIITPTRELAIQIADVGKKIAQFLPKVSFGLAVGGLNLRQQELQLQKKPDIVIATPGRLVDHLKNSMNFNVDSLDILVLDEADRMLEDGFQEELKEILDILPKKRQTMLFSATMNSKIKQLIALSLNKPVRLMINPPKQAANKLVQEFVRIRNRDTLKQALLYNLLTKLDAHQQFRIVVFIARKEQVHKLRIILGLLGLNVAELHGSLTQEQRLQAVTQFKNLDKSVLLCTDLASRGLDIPKIEVVINYDMPKSYEIYLHRIGRTARAGREGRSISFVGETTQDRNIVKEAIKSISETGTNNKSRGKALGRNVNWEEVEKVNNILEDKKDTIDEILEEEKQEKEILRAEMEIRKGENMLKHQKEILSRPKRTWFKSEKDKKNNDMLQALKDTKKDMNSKKRKVMEDKEDLGGKRSYKKTKTDRATDQEKSFKKQNGKKFKKGKFGNRKN